MNKQKKSLKLKSIKSITPCIILFLIGVVVGSLAVNTYSKKNISPSNYSSNPNQYKDEAAAYIKFKTIKKSFVPSGVPDVYGKELGISFDKVQDAINKVRIYDPTYGLKGKKIALTDLSDSELNRYKKIGFGIACEYCCGAKALIREDGVAACGCAHSAMMRGLAVYLIKNYPKKFNNEQVLEELTKWKRTFFPKQTLSAELDRRAKNGEPGIKQILKEFPDFLPQMVGGC